MADGSRPAEPEGLPHNLEAEQAILGALLLNNDVHERIAGLLEQRHFFEPVHGRIYALAAERIAKGTLASPVTLKPLLAEDQGLAALGGVGYLARLAEATVSIMVVRDYATVVRDLALRRELISIGEQIQHNARRVEGDTDPSEQIVTAEKALYEVAKSGTYGRGFMDFGRALTIAAQAAEAAHQRKAGLAGISSGLRELDRKLGGLRKSDLLILAGRPSMGKTALATNIAFNVARRREIKRGEDGKDRLVAGGVVGFFSLEMSAEQLANRILVSEAQLRSADLAEGKLGEGDFKRFLQVARELEKIPLYIDDTPALPISALAARARRLARTDHGLDVLVVDYLQLVRPASSKGENRVLEISEITQGLKALAKELEIPIIALSQLSRQVEAREDKRPQLADLRESGSIEQDADVVMFVFREEYYHERLKPAEDNEKFSEWMQKAEKLHGRAEVIIGKQRHGPIGTVELHFEAKYTKFTDLVRENSGYLPDGQPGYQPEGGEFR
ncbi:MAG: replicative DNA helicase [Paracoccaceae bacterium]